MEHHLTLDEKLAIAREHWNDEVDKIDMESLLFERLHKVNDDVTQESFPSSNDPVTPADETPTSDEATEDVDDNAQEAQAPKNPVVEFDLTVWQLHDVTSKIENAFGGKGYKYV